MLEANKIMTLVLIPLLTLTPASAFFSEHNDSANSHTDSEDSVTSNRAITSSDLIWPMFGKDEHHTFIGSPTPKGVYTPAEKWDADFNIDSLGAAIGNFADNIFGAARDVNFVVYADSGIVYIVDGETNESAWELDVDLIDSVTDNDLVHTSPAIGDLNKNGKMDVVIAVDDSTNTSHVYAYEPIIQYGTSGYTWKSDNYVSEQLWAYSTGVDMSFSSPVLADLDTNGFLDVIIGGADTSAWVFAINGNDGSKLSGNWPYQLQGSRPSTPAIYEFGSSSRVVITSIELETYYINIISDTGLTLHEKSIDMSLPIGLVYSLVPSPAVGQLNRSSSNDEIVVLVPLVTSAGRAYCYSDDLTELWSATYTSGQFESSPALVDIDKDPNGDLDVIAASWDSFGAHMYAIEGRTGDPIWDTYKNLGVGIQNIIASPALVDVSTDGNIDAVFAAQDVLYALNGTNGDFLWNFTLGAPTGTRIVRSSPALGDIDKDQFLDIFIDGSLISHYIIDLTLDQDDVEFSKTDIIQGQEVSITAIIHNTGEAEAENVVVSFLVNGDLIGNATVDSIPGGNTRGATVSWTPEEAGDAVIKIIVDPENNIEEIVENNNEISLTKTVKAAFPDLTFDELKFYRGDGKQIDNINTHLIEAEESTVAAVVRNVGGLKADNILVRFRVDSVNLGVDQLIGRLGVNQSIEIGLNWTPNNDYYTVDAVVDPVNGIVEVNESNNVIRENALYVKSNDPGGASFIMTGRVYQPDGITPAQGVQVTFTNQRTNNFFTSTTSSDGRYSRDLADMFGGYLEGDSVSIFVTDGTNESLIKFKAYSEDNGRFDNITLTNLPRYTVGLSVLDDALDIDPAGTAVFTIFVENQGNTNNSINLNHTVVIDVNTGLPAVNWSINLDAYSADDLDVGAQIERKLTLRAPSKSSEAAAGQVVRATVNAKSAHDSSQTDSITVYATLTRKYIISMEVNPVYLRLDPGETTTAQFSLNLTNFGNGPDRVSFTITNVTLDVISTEVESSIELSAGQSKSSPLKLHINPNHPQGSYQLSIQARSEDGTTTDPKHLVVEIIRPDLTLSASDIELPSNLPGIGDLMTVTIRVHNNGSAPARFVDIEIQEDGASIADDTIELITANSAKFAYLEILLSRSGLYELKIVLDPNNFIIESDEDNNEVIFSFELFPDLSFIGNLEMDPFNPREGDEVLLKATIKNVGQVAVNENFKVEFYYYKSGQRTSIAKLDVDTALNDGATLELSTKWNARQGISSVYCMVDSSRNIYEKSENNNEIVLNISVRPAVVDESDEGGINYLLLGVFVFIVIVLLIVYLMYIAPVEEDEEEESEEDDKSKAKTKPTDKDKEGRKTAEAKKAAVEKSKKPDPKKSELDRKKAEASERAKSRQKDEKKEAEEEDEIEEAEVVGIGTISKGIEGLKSLAKPKKRKVKKIKKRRKGEKPVEVTEVIEDESELAARARQRRKQEAMSKIKKADSFLSSRELQDKEKQLERKSEVLKKRERELKGIKDDLVEIGILETDVIDELEKEEVEEAEEEDEVMEVEPID